MGNVVNFAIRVAEIRAAKADAANDSAQPTNADEDRSTPEGETLYQALTVMGVTILDEDSLRDYRTVMKLVRGMKDRQAGKTTSDDCVMLECVAQGLGYHKEIPHDDIFDDLLSKLD